MTVFFSAVTVWAGIVIKAETDRTGMTLDEVVTCKFTITSSDRPLPVPVFPGFEGFTVLSSAQSSTTIFQQGAQEVFVVYAFVLAPRKTGVLTINPAVLTVGKDMYSSESIEIEVKEGVGRRISPEPRQEPPLSLPESGQPESQEPKYIL